MAKSTRSSEMITFKVDPSVREALAAIPNRSEFIRSAVLSALQNVCPLCHGAGILTPHQRRHWEAFATDHALRECTDCHEHYLACSSHNYDVHR